MRKTYQIPSVEMVLLMPSAIILAGSPGAGISGGSGGTGGSEFPGGSDPIGD